MLYSRLSSFLLLPWLCSYLPHEPSDLKKFVLPADPLSHPLRILFVTPLFFPELYLLGSYLIRKKIRNERISGHFINTLLSQLRGCVHICHLINFVDKGRCTRVMTLVSSLEAAGMGRFVVALLQQVLRLLHFSSGCSPFICFYLSFFLFSKINSVS